MISRPCLDFFAHINDWLFSVFNLPNFPTLHPMPKSWYNIHNLLHSIDPPHNATLNKFPSPMIFYESPVNRLRNSVFQIERQVKRF